MSKYIATFVPPLILTVSFNTTKNMIEKSPLDAYRQAQQRQEAAASPPTTPDDITFTCHSDRVIRVGDFKIDTTTPIELPPFSLQIDGVGVMPSGITAVTGLPKRGKTQFLNVIAACLLSGKTFGSMTPLTKVIAPFVWIDTEQSEWEIKLNAARLFRAMGLSDRTAAESLNLHFYGLRGLTIEERRQFIVQTACVMRPQFLVIDGLRDLMQDATSQAESTDVITDLLQLTHTMPDLTLISVLHKTEGAPDKIMRGSIGTDLAQKCNTVFKCDKKDGYFVVENELTRQRAASPFMFYIDDNGDYKTLDAVSTTELLSDVDAEAVEDTLHEIFAENPDKLTFDGIANKVIRRLGISKSKISTAKKLVKRINDASTPIFVKRGNYYVTYEK